jgi:lysophospholipase L1-like esterase
MSWVRATRRAAVYGGGGIVGASAGMVGLLAAQARLARRFIGEPQGEPPVVDGVWLPDGTLSTDAATRAAVRIAILGDSSAAGLGVDEVQEAPGALIATDVARHIDAPVALRSTAFVGAQSRDLLGQIEVLVAQDESAATDVAVIMVGANDVTHRVLAMESARHLDAALTTLTTAGIDVVVGTCPDLGTIRPIAHPLRLVCRHWSRALASRQAQVVAEHGARSVALHALLGPEFDANPHEMFGPDRFHPSAAGYAAASAALTPDVLALIDARRGINGSASPAHA